MKTMILVAALVAAIPALADCNEIRDYDRRQACLAEQRGSPDTCTSIRNPDDREVCRQRARREQRWRTN
jgi:hypothetical protein